MSAKTALLPHERLESFDVAIAFAALADRHAVKLQRARPDLADQVRRASASVVLNLAEGCSEYRPADKAKFYRYSRRSNAEAAAALTLAARCGVLEDAQLQEALDVSRRLGVMLIHLIRSVESRR